MARDYARIMTAIWRNDEFRALSEAPQRAYLLLVTQPDISAAGVLALRVRRWADMASGSTAESIIQALKALETGRFVVVDWEAEELLVRSFIRWDGGANNLKRRPSIMSAAGEVTSPSIMWHIAAELRRCGIAVEPDTPPDGASGSHPGSLSGSPSETSDVTAGREPSLQVNSLSDGLFSPLPPEINISDRQQEVFSQVDRLSDSHADRPRVVSSRGDRGNPKDQKLKPTKPSVSRAEDAHGLATAQILVSEWIDLCRKRPPTNVIGQTSKTIKQLLEDGLDPDDIRIGIKLWAAKGLHPSALPSVVNEIMNSTPTVTMLPTTTIRVQAGLQIAEQRRARRTVNQTPPQPTVVPGAAS